MAKTHYQKKCASCGSSEWTYIREMKMFQCLFCGSFVERREQREENFAVNNAIRQTLMDIAYRRIEQADRDLSECQRVDSKYVGTLIAGICCRMIAAFNGRYFGGQDPRAMLGQIRRDYMQLCEQDEELGVDETEFYDFLESSDCWAMLAMCFDTLGDTQRCEYLLTMADLKQIFSKETNKSLLRFALKNNRLDMAEEVLENRRNVDITDALNAILKDCPDGEPKARMVASLIQDGAVRDGNVAALEEYMSGGDGAGTKAVVAGAACSAGLQLSLDVTIRSALVSAEVSKFRELLAALLKRRLPDSEVEQLLSMAQSAQDPDKAMAIVDALAESGQFVSINGKQVQGFINKTSTTPEHRIRLIGKLKGFTGPEKMWETVTGIYLCQVAEPVENRTAILNTLCEDLTSVLAKDFEQYVLTCNLDGGEKPQRIRQLLGLPNMNVGFFRGLIGKYTESNKDAPEHTGQVLQALMECGLAVDGSMVLEYICSNSGTGEEKIEILNLVQQNGTVLRADTLSTYLERCAKTFDPELFAALYRENAVISPKALENYLLVCRDLPEVKLKHALGLSGSMSSSFGGTQCRFKFQGCDVSGNLAQAYILLTEDQRGLAMDLVQAMVSSGTKLNTPVEVDGVSKKFSKFVLEKRSQLTVVADDICQTHRLFSRFF